MSAIGGARRRELNFSLRPRANARMKGSSGDPFIPVERAFLHGTVIFGNPDRSTGISQSGNSSTRSPRATRRAWLWDKRLFSSVPSPSVRLPTLQGHETVKCSKSKSLCGCRTRQAGKRSEGRDGRRRGFDASHSRKRQVARERIIQLRSRSKIAGQPYPPMR